MAAPLGVVVKAPGHVVGLLQLFHGVVHVAQLFVVRRQRQGVIFDVPVILGVAVEFGLVDRYAIHARLNGARHAMHPLLVCLPCQAAHQVNVQRHAGLSDQINGAQCLCLTVQPVRGFDDLVIKRLHAHAHAVHPNRQHGFGLGFGDGDGFRFHGELGINQREVIVQRPPDAFNLVFEQQTGSAAAKVNRDYRAFFQVIHLRGQFDLPAERIDITIHALPLVGAAQVGRLVVAIATALNAKGRVQVKIQWPLILHLRGIHLLPMGEIGIVGHKAFACRVPVIMVLARVNHR